MNKTAPLYLSMAVAGLAGYLSLWLAVRNLTPVQYSLFGSFWAAMYFAVGSLGGIQQEVTRASTTSVLKSQSSTASSARPYFLLASMGIGAVIVCTLVWYLVAVNLSVSPQTIDFSAWIFPLAIGLSGYVVVAVIAGNLYGIQEWLLLSWMILGDAVLRLIFIFVTFIVAAQFNLLYWAVALPFPLTILFLTPWIVRKLRGKTHSDVGLRELSVNSLQAIVAASGMATIMSGYPMIVAATSVQEVPQLVSQTMFAITVARAPFIVIAVSLQSLILVKFKAIDNIQKLLRQVAGYLSLTAFLTIGLSLIVGKPFLEFLLGTDSSVSSIFINIIVIAGIAVAFLIVTGVAALSQSLHAIYALGWLTAAAATIGLLMMPVNFELRVACSLLISPILGITIHLVGLRIHSLR